MTAKDKAAYEDACDIAYGEWNDMSDEQQDEAGGESGWMKARIAEILAKRGDV